MSTLKTVNIQHPSSSTPAITLDSAGAMTGSFPYPNRNLLYNGAMQISQRGTSVSATTTTAYHTADRWNTPIEGLGAWTQTVESDAPTGSGLRRSLKMLCTTAKTVLAADDVVLIQQILEGQDLQRIAKGTASAQQLTLSFWAKANVTGTYIVRLRDLDNTRHVAATYTVSASATWEKKTITFPADTTGAFDNDNAGSLAVQFWLGAGSTWTGGTLATTWASTTNANSAVGQINLASATNNFWQITGVQLETGSVATPFEFKSYAQELRECQRYYYRLQPGAISKALSAGAMHVSTTQSNAQFPFPVTMRTAPSAIEQSGTANQYSINIGGSVIQCSSVPTHGGVTTADLAVANFFVASGLTAGYSGRIQTDGTNGAPAYLAWSAEL